MQKNLLQHLVRWALAATCLSTIVNAATAGSFTRGCAVRDLQILMLIEGHESANAISAETLSVAIFAMKNAQMACYEGRVVDAMVLYDSISQSVTANFPPSTQRVLERATMAEPMQP